MREILFRGKTVNHGWKEGFIGYTKDPYGTQIFWTEHIDNEPFTHKDYVHKETIGQYTGLTDKNGKKIFEGDIIKIVNKKRFVFYGVASYRHSAPNSYAKDLTVKDADNCEVIGNIYDNPELLEVAERLVEIV